jgi:hypothetical protein
MGALRCGSDHVATGPDAFVFDCGSKLALSARSLASRPPADRERSALLISQGSDDASQGRGQTLKGEVAKTRKREQSLRRAGAIALAAAVTEVPFTACPVRQCKSSSHQSPEPLYCKV